MSRLAISVPSDAASRTRVVDVDGLSVHFRAPALRSDAGVQAVVRAIDGVTFQMDAGRTLGLVGESGSGKSTIARAILGLLRPTSGSVRVFGVELAQMAADDRRRVRRRMQAVFQDPYASLNAFKTIREILGQPLKIHKIVPAKQRASRVVDLLSMVGLDAGFADRYPRDFSGGQRQRIAIARALASEPDFVVLDEPLSSLDVSIQAQIVNLLLDLRDKLGLTYLFIAHDLSVVRLMADDVVVLYAGKVMERATGKELFAAPLHPYTLALIAAVPVPDPASRRIAPPLREREAAAMSPATGCRFRLRCAFAREKCQEEPPLADAGGGHMVACHFWEEIQSSPVAKQIEREAPLDV